MQVYIYFFCLHFKLFFYIVLLKIKFYCFFKIKIHFKKITIFYRFISIKINYTIILKLIWSLIKKGKGRLILEWVYSI